MKLTNIYWMAAIALIVLTTAEFSRGQRTCADLSKKGYPKYRVAQRSYTATDRINRTLLLYISIEQSALNSETMLKLAERIKNDFCQEQRIQAVFFDQYKIAKRFVPHPESGTYHTDMTRIKGGYFIDRQTGEEYVTFSAVGKGLSDERKIIISQKTSK
jgi:hypothetical protein